MANVLKNSAIYSLLNLLQKGINFLLIPVLTVYLTTYDYGVVAVVTVINAFLNVLYLCSLNGSLNRFYYEYKDDDVKISKLFGTIVSFVFFFSSFLSIVLFVGHEYLIDPFLKNIDFYPYMFIGMVSILFNPVFAIYQSTLMAKQEASKFGKNSFMFFAVNIILLIISVVFLDLGAKGVLGALALTNIVFFVYTISKFGKDIKLGIDVEILKQSLKYSLPLIPHSIAGVATSLIDRVVINSFLSTSLVGVYHIGSTFGGIIFIIASSVNQAFIPWFNEQAKQNKTDEIPEKASLLILFYCVIALGLSFFGKEIIHVVTPDSYKDAWEVIPFISFAFVLHGTYYFYSIPLFYDLSGRGNRILPIVTIFAALTNIALNFMLIPEYGIVGASVATIISKLILVLSLSFIYRNFLNINYSNVKMILLPLIFFILSLVSYINLPDYNDFVVKIGIYLSVLIIVFLFNKSEILSLKFFSK